MTKWLKKEVGEYIQYCMFNKIIIITTITLTVVVANTLGGYIGWEW
jgi:hypothetical protein